MSLNLPPSRSTQKPAPNGSPRRVGLSIEQRNRSIGSFHGPELFPVSNLASPVADLAAHRRKKLTATVPYRLLRATSSALVVLLTGLSIAVAIAVTYSEHTLAPRERQLIHGVSK